MWLLFFPVLIAVLFWFVLPVLMLVLMAIGWSTNSFFWIIAKPSYIFKILTNKVIRKNHALEHATENILISEGYLRVSGISTEKGYLIQGVPSPEVVYEASLVALNRLRSGQKDLAISKSCGITLVWIDIILVLLLILSGNFGFFMFILTLIVGYGVNQLFGASLQRYLLVDTDVSTMQILSASEGDGNMEVLKRRVYVMNTVFVSTSNDDSIIEAELVE